MSPGRSVFQVQIAQKLGCHPSSFLCLITCPPPAFNPCEFQEFSFQIAPKPTDFHHSPATTSLQVRDQGL